MEMTKKINLGILVCLVIILGNMGVRFFLVTDQVHQVAELQQLLSRVRHPSGSALPRTSANETGTGLETGIQKIYGEIPSRFHLIGYGTDIRHLLGKHRLNIRDSLVFIPAETQMPDLIRFNTRVAADGSYPDIKAFLADVCNLPGLVFINTVQMERRKDDRSPVQLALDLSLIFQQAPHHDVRDFSNEE